MQTNEIIGAIDADILWHEQNPEEAPSAEYRKGFINGLIQAKYIIGEVKRMASDSDDEYEQDCAYFRREAARITASTIAEIVRDLQKQTGCRVDVDVRALETTTFSDLAKGEASYEPMVEVTLNEQYVGRA